MSEEDEQAMIQAAADAGRDPRSRRWQWVGVGMLLLGLTTFGVSGWMVLVSTQNSAATLATQVLEECSRGALKGAICEQADDTEKTVDQVPVPGLPGEPGKPGGVGPRGPAPTPAEIRSAVRSYCSDGRCSQAPTAAQVAAAVAAFCDGGKCDGEAGQDGADSLVPGPKGDQGPGPTDDQIQAAVAAYCSDGNCRGEAGPPGTADPGTYRCDDGKYVTAITVADDGVMSLECASLVPTVPDTQPGDEAPEGRTPSG